MTILASIPSPGDNALYLRPLQVRAYGLVIALGIVVATGFARRRWLARGGNPDDITAITLWAVPAGLVGARLYHVITDWSRFEGRRWEVVAVWEGGLGTPGGLIAGVLTVVWVVRRRGLPAMPWLSLTVVGLACAAAIRGLDGRARPSVGVTRAVRRP